MSDEEVDELLKAVDTSKGEINYTGTSSCTAMTLHAAHLVTDLVRMILAN